MPQRVRASQDRSSAVDGRQGPGDHLPTEEAVTPAPALAEQPKRSVVLYEVKLAILSLALFAPALLPYAAHFAFPPPGRMPTGFIDYDLPYYLANAREHFDDGRFHFFYSNPFDPNYASPRIYVQPMTLRYPP